MKKHLAFIATTMLVAGISVFTACKKEETPKQYAQLDVIQANPDAPGVSIQDDTVTISDFVLLFGANTGYKQIEAGQRTIKAMTYRVDTADTAYYQAQISLKEKAHYSLFLIDSAQKSRALFVSDELTDPPAGKALVRFIHLSYDCPRIDLVRTGDAAVVFGSIGFMDVTSFTAMPAGVYNWGIRNSGKDTIFSKTPTLVFNTGKIYTVYLKGHLNGSGKKALSFSMITNRL